MSALPCVAVAGASGFVGRALVHALRAQGHRVHALARRPIQPSHPDNRAWPPFDNLPALAQAMAPASVLIHLAARAHQGQAGAQDDDALFAGNLTVTQALLQAAHAAGVQRVVLVSSIGVNGRHTTSQAFTETDAPAPTEAYARSKLQCEALVAQACGAMGMDHVIVRPPLVYGPHAPGNFGRLIQAVAQGWPLPLGAVHNRRSLVGIDNLVDALALCAVHPAAAGQTYLVSDGEDVSTTALLRLTAHAMGRQARLLPIPETWLRVLAGWSGRSDAIARLCDSLQVDSNRLRTDLAWRPPLTLAQGIARAVEPFRKLA